MKQVCDEIARGRLTGPLAVVLNQPVESELQDVARVFVELQQLRHQADYDVDYAASRTDVLQKILMAEEAFEKWRRLRRNPNAIVFLTALLFHGRWRQ